MSDYTSETAQPLPPAAPQPLSPADERTWAMLAHLSVLLNLFTAVGGIAGALIIYLVYKDRSRYVAYQSLQSLIMQGILWMGGSVIAGVFWAATSILSALIIGVVCVPLACIVSLLPVVSIVYGIVGGIKCYQGADFQYWLIGNWVRSTLTG